MPIAILGALVLLALIVLPELWVMSVLHRHSKPRPNLPGTGGEFARHLLDGLRLANVKVEETDLGDHYHPLAKAVRLKTEHFHGRSLTAIVIAAHEVGHAMQDATGYAPLQTRTRMAASVEYVQRAGMILFIASPILALVLRNPAAVVLGIAAGILMNASAVVMHAVTLPVEFDASFNRALPLLQHGRLIAREDMGAARHILTAAAYTYVAAALVSLINVTRWLRR
jgi:Zn-dependent membrane protease YugP